MRRATQRTAIPEMPLQIRAARPVRASVQKNRPSFPPVFPHPALPSTSYLFFLIFLFCVCLVLLHAVPASHTSSFHPPPPPRVVQSHRRRRVASSRKREDGAKEKGREENAVTRENPLRNVFGPCTTQCYLQSRACVKYTCKRRKDEGVGA